MATQSLASRSKELSSILPESLASQVPAVPVIETPPAPYVGYFSPKSGKATDIMAACPGIRDGDAYVAFDGKFKKLDPFKFHLLAYKQLWVECDETMEIQAVSERDPGSWKSPLKEHFEVALLVYAGDEVIAARGTFRTTKSDVMKRAAKELTFAQQGAWASQSKEHEQAAGIAVPFARFTCTATTQKKTAKGTGLPFYLGSSTPRPTTVGEWKQLEGYFTKEDSKAAMQKVLDAFNARVEDLLTLAK